MYDAQTVFHFGQKASHSHGIQFRKGAKQRRSLIEQGQSLFGNTEQVVQNAPHRMVDDVNVLVHATPKLIRQAALPYYVLRARTRPEMKALAADRKSTRLNSSH